MNDNKTKKDKVRYRRDRNMVAKNNRHRGGYHTPHKFERSRPKLVSGTLTTREIQEWWEHNL